MLSISKFFQKESKPDQPSSALERFKEKLNNFQAPDLQHQRHFAALGVWGKKVNTLATDTPLNPKTQQQLSEIYVEIAHQHIALLETTERSFSHPMIIEQSLEAAKINLEKAQEHSPSETISEKIERINRRIQKCDQEAPTYVQGQGEVTWAKAKEIAKDDPSRHISIPGQPEHKDNLLRRAPIIDIKSGKEITNNTFQAELPALNA